MAEANILSYWVLAFERDEDAFHPPHTVLGSVCAWWLPDALVKSARPTSLPTIHVFVQKGVFLLPTVRGLPVRLQVGLDRICVMLCLRMWRRLDRHKTSWCNVLAKHTFYPRCCFPTR